MVSLTEQALKDCRALIAHGYAATDDVVDLGEITLRRHQREAVARVRLLIDRHRGCLLADDVGRGKTYVALAVARRWRCPLVVVPASLQQSWRTAMRRAGVEHPLLTHESLSRGGRPPFEPDGIIVDESHRFRNPATIRYGALADVAIRAELLLLSATPVQNSTDDLVAQLALFLGSGAMHLSESQLLRHVVRVDGSDREALLPGLATPRWVRPHTDDSGVLRAILALPAPPRALDAGDAGILRTLALVRAWASSRAALVGTLARRRQTAVAIEQSIDAGRMPTLAELRSWRSGGDETLQLGFAALLVERLSTAGEARELHGALSAEHTSLDRLALLLREGPDVDLARADALTALVRSHPGERVLAFTELASTARAYYARLRAAPHVALLTAGDARIASGRITRDELLARFAPQAQGYAEPVMRERIDLLISTDLLSEGVNLQDASVVVHLDLPWNPARLAQRVGRVRRPGGPKSEVTSYLLAPPADTELLLHVETRLRRKLDDAARTIGRGIGVVPALTQTGTLLAPDDRSGIALLRAAVHARVGGWALPTSATLTPEAVVGHRGKDSSFCIAAAESEQHGWLALLPDGRLLGAIGCVVSDDEALLDRATAAAAGHSRDLLPDDVERALSAIRDHLARDERLAHCGVSDQPSPVARTVERHAAQLIHRAPRHERAQHLHSLSGLRRALARPLSLGAERAFARLMASHAESLTEWLDSALDIVTQVGSVRAVERSLMDEPRVLIAFGPCLSSNDRVRGTSRK